MTEQAVDLRTLAKEQPVHFVGIGGAGMFALASLLLRQGARVTGCDLKESRALEDLRALGAEIHVGHDALHVDQASALVVTSAVPTGHPELLRAREREIPVLKRAQALGACVNGGCVVAIAGTHGKTTTTAMATEILARAGKNPTGLVGGRVPGWSGNLRFGSDELFVVEADEYDRSFHALTPDVAVVTNLEADHLDIYGDLDGVREGFVTFLQGMRDGGRTVVCADDVGASSLLAGAGSAGYSYGTSAGSMLRATEVRVTSPWTTCRVVEDGVAVGDLSLSIGGIHNLRNALGAAAASRVLGAQWSAIFEALASFRGVRRRFERLGESRGVVLIDDYAHHPTEIEATLTAARSMFPQARIVVAFQPHLYSRTRDFAEAFGRALAFADLAYVTDVFPAREAPLPGITGEIVVAALEKAGLGDVRYVKEIGDLAEVLLSELREGDVLLTVGAGSIENVAQRVLDGLEATVHA